MHTYYKLFNFFIIILLINVNLNAYDLKSSWLKNPSSSFSFVDSCANFWILAHDDVNGGFYHDISRNGDVLSSAKGLVSLSRNAYGFIRSFMLTGNEAYLDYARSALDYMYENLWDEENGGWISTNEKTAFDHHYALLGIAAAVEVMDNKNDREMLEKGLNFIEKAFWDDREDYMGYYDKTTITADYSWNKSFNATVDAITTHQWLLFLLTRDEKYKIRLLELKKNILNHLYASMQYQQIGFAELYNSNWEIDEGQRRTIMGHVLKTAWSLGRLSYVDLYDRNCWLTGEKMIKEVLENGYDHEFGGPYKDYDRIDGSMYMYGALDTAKAWWQMEQAVMAGLYFWGGSKDSSYLKMADESLNFFLKYFVDKEYGEVYADRSRNGGKVKTDWGYWDENKGSAWKAAYHSIETAYYTYLYATTFIHTDTVTLHYNFSIEEQDRDVRLEPIQDIFLTPVDVSYKNNNYSDFSNFTLHLPAGRGGHFIVNYIRSVHEIDEITEQAVPQTVYMGQNYPNPFNSKTVIPFRLDNNSHIIIKIFDIKGRLIDIPVNAYYDGGDHKINWNSENIVSGLYFYMIEGANNQQVKKMLIVK